MVELSKTYNPKEIESKWYSFWEERGLFKANPSSKQPPFSLVMPPPNVTGILHMGHVLGNTLMDVLVRWKRMQGFKTLWIPGTDHAGIATQMVVERFLREKFGKRRKDYTREEFVSHIWDFKEKTEDTIVTQLRRLGCSCDWSRQRFTMDEKSNLAVRRVFKKMYDEGVIYRGDYLVNWDPVTQTALADDEVEFEERKGFLWYFNYPLSDGSAFIPIATTRPETMLGDTGVAVSGKDERYKHLIGKTVMLPIMDRKIPIFSDRRVDPEFGTGAVKITPAHDPNDYEMGISHNLPFINIMTPDGRVNENGGPFQEMTMAEARIHVVEKMRELGLLIKIENHPHRVGVSYRSKATIEPYISKQWFIKMSNFKDKLLEAVDKNKIKIHPKSWEQTYRYWINNLKDWCISRQLWWGHRIPVWYHKNNPEKIICFTDRGLPKEVQANPNDWYQDEDVLDTWFSSALWPFSTLGWPDNTDELQAFYPNSILVTGHDILFFWVARMLMMGEYIQNTLPFPEVLLTGLIFGKSYWRINDEGHIHYVSQQERLDYDLREPTPKDVYSKWEKISKSKGNAIDPLEIIDQYGTDAMRMAFCASPVLSHQIDLDRRKFEDFKNFANKLWNGARFIFMNLQGNEQANTTALSAKNLSKGLDFLILALEDKWILSRLNRTIEDVNGYLTTYNYEDAAISAYNFYWKELCAYYLEIVKPVLFGKSGDQKDRENKQILLVILLTSAIRLLHPMAPFITEELFQLIKEYFDNIMLNEDADIYTKDTIQALLADSCMIAPYPKVLDKSAMDQQIENGFNLIEQVVYTIRNIRGEMKIAPGIKTDIYIVALLQDKDLQLIKENQNIIPSLLPTQNIFIDDKEPDEAFSSTGFVGSIKIIIPLPEELQKQEQARLEKEVLRIQGNVDKLKNKLSNVQFIERAPKELVDKQKQLLQDNENKLKEIEEKLAILT